MTMNYVLGIDPGKHGAIAIYDGEELIVHDMPLISNGTKDIIDEVSLAQLVDANSTKIKHAYIEKVGAMPQQGTVSMFSFGEAYGLIKGIIAAHYIRRTLVRPQDWKKALSIPKDKDQSRLRAKELFPNYARYFERKKDEGRAEAALIAYYGFHGVPGAV